MTSTTIFEIPRPDLSKLILPSKALITNVKHLSSYNWIEAPTPTIAVPGSPPLWSNTKGARQMKKDSGRVYIAQNAARHPDSPLEPLFRALYHANPLFDIRSIDVVSDRNNIRKLLSFIDPGSSKNGLEAFTINIEVMKNTAIFCREETVVQEFIRQDDFRGFGHEFEKAYTTNQIHCSTGHHRIISYRFSGLNLIIRHETDGFIGVDEMTESSSREPGGVDLSRMLGSLSLSSPTFPSGSIPAGSKLTIRQEGQIVALDSTLEIKTRVRRKPLTVEEVAPQLWISQTPKLVRAYHERGKFQVPVVEDVAAQIKGWEESNQKNLKTLAAVIAKIIGVVKPHGHVVVKCDNERDSLIFRKAEGKKMLPEDLYMKWEAVNLTDNRRDVAAGITQTELSQIPTDVEAAPTSSETVMTIGDTVYGVPLSKMPYLSSFVDSERILKSPKVELKHDPIPLFNVALSGINSGYRQCFRMLDVDINLFQSLCETYRLLGVDVLEGQSIDDITTNIKAGKIDFELDEYRGNKKLARDSAFRLVYFMLCGELGDGGKYRNELFNAVFYVVSHPGTFRYKARCIVRAAYEHRLRPSGKQVARLNEWRNDKDANEDDGTTEWDETGRNDLGDHYSWSDSS